MRLLGVRMLTAATTATQLPDERGIGALLILLHLLLIGCAMLVLVCRRPACIASCSATDKNKVRAAFRKMGCGRVEKNMVAAKLKLKVDLATVNADREQFVDKFTTDIGAALKVEKERVGVTGIKAGSVRPP